MPNKSASSAPATPRAILRWFRLRPRVFGVLLLLIGLGGGAHILWRYHSPRIARHPQYALTADNIHITTPPPWIRSDIKAQVLRDTGLVGTISLLDDWSILSRRVRDAFEFHPWIAAVERITKRLPASLHIELTYRRPIAAVEASNSGGVSYLPIDERGVRLPEADLTEAERRYLPRIAGIAGRPLVGDVWPDPRVTGGARLIAALADIWQQLRLVEIIALPQSQGDDRAPLYTFEIVTSGGTRILWGAAPGMDASSGESSVSEKRQRLLDFAANDGRLDSIDGPATIDVRTEFVVTPRTARKGNAKIAQ
jgi:hypothetical protein